MNTLIDSVRESIKDFYLTNDSTVLAFRVKKKKRKEKRSRLDKSYWLEVVYRDSGGIKRTKLSHRDSSKVKLHGIDLWSIKTTNENNN